MFNPEKMSQKRTDQVESVELPKKEKTLEELKEDERNLNKLQGGAVIDGAQWDREKDFPRLNEIRALIQGLESGTKVLSKEEDERVRELRMAQFDSKDWTPEKAQELEALLNNDPPAEEQVRIRELRIEQIDSKDWTPEKAQELEALLNKGKS